MDESGLSFIALSDKSLSIKGEESTGGSHSKDINMASLSVNLLGEFDSLILIGKSAKPQVKYLSFSILNYKYSPCGCQ